MKIDLQILQKILESQESDAKSHAPHGEDNLCTGCMIKRQLWNVKRLQQMCRNAEVEMVLQIVKDPEFSPVFVFMETLCIGFEIGIAYAESLQLKEQIK